MTDGTNAWFRRQLETRLLVIEPLTMIAIISLLASWAIQPFVSQALIEHGTAAQGAAQAALWLSGVLSPITAFMKALGATLVCWSCAVFLGERVSFGKLLSVFCIAEMLFSLRDIALVCVLAAHGLANVHSTADLMVAFGISGFLHSQSAMARMAFESWDAFTVAWALFSFWMIRALFKTDTRAAACLAVMAFAFRTLFAAAGQLYTL
jgi:hypothetical protein